MVGSISFLLAQMTSLFLDIGQAMCAMVKTLCLGATQFSEIPAWVCRHMCMYIYIYICIHIEMDIDREIGR